jgi:quercetin dioxygenase-like cupin family protein
MAVRGQEIRNLKTGQRIKFLQTTEDTKGAFLEMVSTFETRSCEPLSHYHPYQEEFIEIVSGEISVRVNDEIEVLGPGHQLYIAKNTNHSMWNSSDKPATIRWKVVPALETERFLETVTAFANEGKVRPDGKPTLLQKALTTNRFCNCIRLAGPPYFLQKIAFILLTPIAYLLGYTPETRARASQL